MNRLERLEHKLIKLESKDVKKKFKLPFKTKNIMKQSVKKSDHVLVLYLTQKYTMDFKLCKVVSGDIVVINNKAHKLNPKKIWRYKKFTVYIIREIDREPVSNEDIDEIKDNGNSTSNDVVLIKAVLGATQKEKKIESKNVLIAIGVLAAIGFVLYIIFGGG